MPQPTKKINRLSDFVIEEVSLVDRAANKRKFLLFKNDAKAPMTTTTIRPNGNGTFTAESESDEGEKTLSVKNIDAVEQVFTKVGEAVDRLMRVASVALQADSLKLGDGPNEDTVITEIEAVKQILSDVASEIGEVREGATEKRSDTPTSESDKFLDDLEEFKEMLAKRGAPMEQGRLKQFTSALTELATILGEVGGDVEDLVDKSGTSARGGRKRRMKSEPADIDADSDNPESDEVAELRKQLEATKREVATLKREPAVPTTVPVEVTESVEKVQEFSWPSDMNKPLGEDDVSPENSFYTGR